MRNVIYRDTKHTLTPHKHRVRGQMTETHGCDTRSLAESSFSLSLSVDGDNEDDCGDNDDDDGRNDNKYWLLCWPFPESLKL